MLFSQLVLCHDLSIIKREIYIPEQSKAGPAPGETPSPQQSSCQTFDGGAGQRGRRSRGPMRRSSVCIKSHQMILLSPQPKELPISLGKG